MAEPAARRATYSDIEAASSNVVAEIIRGTLVTQPRPSPRHGVAANALGAEVTSEFQFGRDGPGGWIFVMEPELHLGEDVVVPDIAGWRRERLPTLPETPFFSIVPDWVCEVLSPSTEKLDRTIKRDIYGAAGTAYLWFLNPREQLLEAFQLVAGKWLLIASHVGAQPVSVAPFETMHLSLQRLWPFDPPAPQPDGA